MDQKKILLLNLSKGRIGEDSSRLLGAMFITKLQLAAMSRVDIPEETRADFYLYVDEFQNFATESFANILSEARKYRLNLIIAHQYIGQLITEGNTAIKDAVFGNVGTIILFRIGAADAEELESEFDPTFTPTAMVNLTKYHIYLKLMINGVASRPFSGITLQPLAQLTGNEDKVIKVSRERYSNPRQEIDERITRWMGQEYHKEAAHQELTEEEEEGERGGVIFTGKSDKTAPAVEIKPLAVAVAEPRPQAPAQKIQPLAPRISHTPAPTPVRAGTPTKSAPAKPKADDIWNQVAKETEKKREETAKKVVNKLVFNFGEKKVNTSPEVKTPLPTPPTAPSGAPPPAGAPSSPVQNQSNTTQPIQPGQKVKF